MNKTTKIVIIVIIILLLLAGGAYLFLNKPAPAANNQEPPVQTTSTKEYASIDPKTCVDLYSGDTAWKKIFTDTFPDLKVEKVGFYCKLDNSGGIVSYSYIANNGAEKGQIIMMVDQENKPLKNIKTAICNTSQDTGYPEFQSADTTSVTVNCSNDKPKEKAKAYKFELEKFSFNTQSITPEPVQSSDTPTVTTEIKQGYGYDSPEWDSLSSDIIKQTKEDLQSFYAPISPTDDNIIYVSTSAGTTGEWPNMLSTNKIYSYDKSTKEITKLYEEKENRLLRTLGIDGTKLILMYDGIDNSPGPCFSPWADWKEFGYMDISNPGKLMTYTVPASQVKKSKQEQEKCMAELNQ